MSNLDAWKARNTFEVTLASGTHVKGRFVDMEQMLMSGRFDYGVLAELGNAEDKGEPPSSEQIAESLRYKREVFLTCLKEIDGEVIELTEDDYSAIPQADRDEFVGYANRTVEVPLAVS